MRKLFAAALAALMCSAVMTGCGNSADNSSSENDTSAPDSVVTTDSSESESASSASAVAAMDNNKMYDGVEITDEAILAEIEAFCKSTEKLSEGEAPEETAKGAYLRITYKGSDGTVTEIYVPNVADDTVSVNDKYYTAETGETVNFCNEMIEFFKAQGWYGE